jgi:hypothetical protein
VLAPLDISEHRSKVDQSTLNLSAKSHSLHNLIHSSFSGRVKQFE